MAKNSQQAEPIVLIFHAVGFNISRLNMKKKCKHYRNIINKFMHKKDQPITFCFLTGLGLLDKVT